MYKRILVPIDGSATSHRAFEAALELARENAAELIPLYVVDVPIAAYQAPGFDPTIVREALFQRGEQLRDEARSDMQRAQVSGTPRVVEVDGPGQHVADRILEEARAARADLVVMGTHGRRGIRRLVLGSVAEQFLRMSCCPVLMIQDSAEGTDNRLAAQAAITEKVAS